MARDGAAQGLLAGGVGVTGQLVAVLQRVQQGATQHIGKVPHRAGSDQRLQNTLLRLRAELKEAVGREDYERAAGIRDQIKEFDTP